MWVERRSSANSSSVSFSCRNARQVSTVQRRRQTSRSRQTSGPAVPQCAAALDQFHHYPRHLPRPLSEYFLPYPVCFVPTASCRAPTIPLLDENEHI